MNSKQPGCASFIAKASFWLCAQQHPQCFSVRVQKGTYIALHLICMKLEEQYVLFQH